MTREQEQTMPTALSSQATNNPCHTTMWDLTAQTNIKNKTDIQEQDGVNSVSNSAYYYILLIL